MCRQMNVHGYTEKLRKNKIVLVMEGGVTIACSKASDIMWFLVSAW